jgi:phosphoglycerol transferase MdoB-like AlkP superfamily enzyme
MNFVGNPIRTMLFHRHGGTVLVGALFLLISFLTRLILLIRSYEEASLNIVVLAKVFACGFFYDLAAASYFLIPFVLYLTALPNRLFTHRLHRRLILAGFFSVIYLLLFLATAEWFFWNEFGSRFNFIAVDYLVYTTEVLGNIRESYPVPSILAGILAVCGLFFLSLKRMGCFELWLQSHTPWKSRLVWGAAILLIPVLYGVGVDEWMIPRLGNNYNHELAKNGLYSLFAAFRNNELSYERFYVNEPYPEAFQELKELLKTSDSTSASQNLEDITRVVKGEGTAAYYNVIQITVESLSAEFMEAFGNEDRLTPNLDALAEQGILFTNLYATGTRTDRGMEALTLSVPPTPGRSIVKRPHNENLFTLGSVFALRGYDTVFLYGGYGYFDNMNHFFGGNGYRVVDRNTASKNASTFANAWGVCDEDLYGWVIAEADKAYAEGRPFYHFVMTTSNHRPYTYPEGKIDIPSHTGRKGAVKYADYAIGEFIRKAKERPWFSNTVFVIVADHCANSAGKADLAIDRYKIPLIFYNPELIHPQKVDVLCSQIDYAPTLLGMLHWSYESRFFGKNVFLMKPAEGRAFISNYQKLGYMNNNDLTILKPVRNSATYRYAPDSGDLLGPSSDEEILHDAVAYYETANYLYRRRQSAPSLHAAAARPGGYPARKSRPPEG